MTDTTARGAGPAERAHHAGDAGPAPTRRRRMSAKRKQRAVLRLLRGEDLELVSRELGVMAAELSAWRDAFLAAAEASLKTRPADGRDLEIGRLKAKVGDLTMTAELLEAKIERLEAGHPLDDGGRGDEPRGLALHEAGLRCSAGDPGLGQVASHAVPSSPMRRAAAAAPAWSAGSDAGRGAGRGDPQAAGRQPIPRRGLPQDLGRLRFAGIRTSKRRVLRLTREHGLQAPGRVGRPHGPKAHDGTIRTERVDEMWGTDLTSTLTGEGQASIFVTVDHCSTECLGIHAARRATRFEALEPLRQGVRACFGAFAEGIANGLTLRHDHGSQFVADDYQCELEFLGIASSPAFVREPEGNGCVERFIRTLKENLLWVRASPRSRSCAWRCWSSSAPTTRPGSSSAMATRPPRPSERRSSRRSQPRPEFATRCLTTVDRYNRKSSFDERQWHRGGGENGVRLHAAQDAFDTPGKRLEDHGLAHGVVIARDEPVGGTQRKREPFAGKG